LRGRVEREDCHAGLIAKLRLIHMSEEELDKRNATKRKTTKNKKALKRRRLERFQSPKV
jgi:hypothetical protein